MFPKVIRAGAGPHDLGPGDNEEDAFPELTVQSNAEHTTSGDEDLITDDPDSDPGTVVRNTPYVWSCRIIFSRLTFAPRTRNMTVGVSLRITYSR